MKDDGSVIIENGCNVGKAEWGGGDKKRRVVRSCFTDDF